MAKSDVTTVNTIEKMLDTLLAIKNSLQLSQPSVRFEYQTGVKPFLPEPLSDAVKATPIEPEPDTIAIPVDALRWLFGLHDDGFEPQPEHYDDIGQPVMRRGAFWWRLEFERRTGMPLLQMVALPPANDVKFAG